MVGVRAEPDAGGALVGGVGGADAGAEGVAFAFATCAGRLVHLFEDNDIPGQLWRNAEGSARVIARERDNEQL